MANPQPPPHLNIVSPENLLDPVLLYKELRENDPVHWSEPVKSWFLTRHEDVVNGFRDPRLSADRSQFLEHQVRLLGLTPEIIQNIIDSLRLQMINADGAAHLRLRRLAGPGFTPQLLDTLRPVIRSTMNTLLERVQPLGRMDLVKELSYQLPPLVICDLLGVPAEDRERFQEWGRIIVQFNSPTVGVDLVDLARRSNEAMGALTQYLAGVVEKRRHNLGRDALSLMIQSEEGGGLSREEVLANAVLLLSAGHLTTTDQLSNGVHDLLSHPEQFQKLCEDPSLIKSAVEEIVRFRPAVPFIHRVAAETFELRGRTIQKGSIVFLGMAAANRDPAVFPEPDTFDITRDHFHQKHNGFGFGPHHCLGAGLARRELEIALEVLIERLPNLRLDEKQAPQVKCSSLLFRGFDSLHVQW
jgi:cytochrome P450